METKFEAKIKQLAAKAPKEEGDDPVMVLTIEVDAGAGEIGEVARFLGKVATVSLKSPQMAFAFTEATR